MRNRTFLVAGIILILMIVLAGCSSAQTATPTQEPTPAAQPSPTVESAPGLDPAEPTAPVVSAQAAYPAPAIQYVAYDPYPAPIEGEQIEWSQVQALLISGQVAEVFQRFSLPIVITMKDGRIILVESPAKDEIFKLLDQCGEQCNDIRRLSEN
jgi:hypothetical protein